MMLWSASHEVRDGYLLGLLCGSRIVSLGENRELFTQVPYPQGLEPFSTLAHEEPPVSALADGPIPPHTQCTSEPVL